MTPLRPGVSLAVLVAALLGAAAPARAETYCVGAAGCSGPALSGSTPGQQFQDAINKAELTPEADEILLGPGRYDQQATFFFSPGNGITAALAIRGVGDVVIANTGTTPDDETLEGREIAPLSISDVTIEGPGNAARSLALEISGDGSTVDRVSFVAPAGGATAPNALYAAINVRQYEVTFRNSVITGYAKALFLACRPGSAGSAVLDHVTVVAAGTPATPGTIDGSCDHEPMANASDPNDLTMRTRAAGKPTVTLANSILGSGVTIRNDANSAVSLDHTRWNGSGSVITDSGVAKAVTTGAGMLETGPGFVSTTDLRLAAGSPMIDAAGDAGAGTDRDGNPRKVGAKPDLGAYEFQPGGSTPTPTVTPTPGGGTPTTTPTPGGATPGPTPPTGGASPTPLPGESGGPGGGGGGGLPQAEPAPTLRLSKGTLRVSSKGRLTVKLKCLTSTRCRGKVRVLGTASKSGKQPVLATSDVLIAAGRTAQVALVIRASSRAVLRRKGGKLSLAYTPKGAAKAADTLSLKISKS